MSQYLSHIEIGGRRIGPGEPAYIIAEAGVNHNGNPEIARRLIDVAAQVGADAIKFQKRNLKSLYSARALSDPTSEEKEIGFILPFLQQAELSDEVFSDLAAHARACGAEFLCTPWDIESLQLLQSLEVRAYKVASADLTNQPLLARLCDTGVPLIVSTGMSRLAEITATVEFLKSRKAQFVLLHCQSTYPAPFKDLNLRFMETLRQFGVPVGYSGHERGIAVSTAVAALGACIIERHLTMDRTMPGPDHAASLEPQGLGKMIRDIRAVEEAMGSPRRSLSRGELLNRIALGKSLVAARDIRSGETVTADMVKAMGPGHGIAPQRLGELVGHRTRRCIANEEQFREADLSDEPLETLVGEFPLRWGPVVRYRDFATMARFKPDLFEFHLTDTDLDAPVPRLPECNCELVVHAPEYYHGRLMDFASDDERLVEHSVDVLKRVMDAARALRGSFTATPPRVRIVLHPGGMSYEPRPETHDCVLDRFCEVLPEPASEPDVEIMVENQAPFPWYFGGQWFHNAFVGAEDMLTISHRTGVRVCLDISHAALACAAGHGELADYVRLLAPHVAHLHIADGSGTDGEGLQIGQGDVEFSAIMPILAKLNASMVPEVWMGHRNDGEGFIVALGRLIQFLA